MNLKDFKMEVWWELHAALEGINFDATLLDVDHGNWTKAQWETNEKRFERARQEISELILRKLK
tara:strand:- start:56 stop:247 length:192 start_codon:yes stop_codon:yes gene_type:complete